MGGRRGNVTVEDACELEIDAPRDIILALLKRVPGIECVQYDDLIMVERPPLDSVLSESEILIFDLMRKHGGAAPWATLRSLVDSGNIMPITFQATLLQSPIFRRLDHGLHAVVGSSMSDPALVRTLQRWQQSKPTTSASTYARIGMLCNQEESISVEVSVPPNIASRGYFELPSTLAPYVCLRDRYRVGDTGKEEISITGCVDHGSRNYLRANGLARIIRARGFGPGERVTLTVFPARRKFVINHAPAENAHRHALGGQFLLEDYRADS